MAQSSWIFVASGHEYDASKKKDWVVDELMSQECFTNVKLDDSDSVVEALLSTKYYTANLSFDCNSSPQQDKDSYEGIIYLFLEPSVLVKDSVEWVLDSSVSCSIAVQGASELNNSFEDFCIEYGLEKVLIGNQLSESHHRSAEKNNEHIGLDRVVEALQCTMWSALSQLGSDSSSSVLVLPEVDPELVPESKKNEKVLTEEEQVEELETLFEQISKIRSESSTLSDTERRRRAADMAFRMISCLGIEEEDTNNE